MICMLKLLTQVNHQNIKKSNQELQNLENAISLQQKQVAIQNKLTLLLEKSGNETQINVLRIEEIQLYLQELDLLQPVIQNKTTQLLSKLKILESPRKTLQYFENLLKHQKQLLFWYDLLQELQNIDTTELEIKILATQKKALALLNDKLQTLHKSLQQEGLSAEKKKRNKLANKYTPKQIRRIEIRLLSYIRIQKRITRITKQLKK